MIANNSAGFVNILKRSNTILFIMIINLISSSDSSNIFVLALALLSVISLLTKNAFSASSSASFAFFSSALVFKPLDLLLLPDVLVMLDLTLF